MVGSNLGKCKWVWEEKLRFLNPRWPNSRWLPSSSWVRMNEFESDWISLSQSQSRVRVFLSESERRKQDVWIPQCRSWIQDGRIQDGHHHQGESESMSEVWVWCKLVGVRIRLASMSVFGRIWDKITRWLNSKMAVAESKMATIQYGCHHQVE